MLLLIFELRSEAERKCTLLSIVQIYVLLCIWQCGLKGFPSVNISVQQGSCCFNLNSHTFKLNPLTNGFTREFIVYIFRHYWHKIQELAWVACHKHYLHDIGLNSQLFVRSFISLVSISWTSHLILSIPFTSMYFILACTLGLRFKTPKWYNHISKTQTKTSKQTNTNKCTQNTREEDVFIKQHFWFRITKFELYELNTAQWISYQQKHIMNDSANLFLSLAVLGLIWHLWLWIE